MPYIRESTLWPILIVVLAHLVAFLAPMFLLAVRDGSGGAWFAIVVTGAITLWAAWGELRAHGRPGAFLVIALLTWVASGALAVAVNGTGIF